MRPLSSFSSRQICIALTVSVFVLNGCATLSDRAERARTLNQVPRWYLSLPYQEAFYLAAGTAESPVMGAAVDIATASARSALVQQIRAEIEGRINDQLKEEQQASGARDSQELSRQYSSEFEIRTRQELYGSRVRDRKVITSAGGYVAWVLVELPKEAVYRAVAAQALEKKNQSADEQEKAFWREIERKMRQP